MDIIKKRNINLAKLLYNEKRYKEAKTILEDNLINAEAKYLMGKICQSTGDKQSAIEWFRQSILTNYKSVSPRIELARILREEGEYEKAEREYNVCLKRENKNSRLRIELAKMYIEIGKYEDAEKLLNKAMHLNENDEKNLKAVLKAYDSMQKYSEMYEICKKLVDKSLIKNDEYELLDITARTCFSLGKYDEALNVFKNRKLDSMGKILHNLYRRRIYCVLSEDKEQAQMYKTILDNLEVTYNENERMKHIEHHLSDNKEKEFHGVFIRNPVEVLEELKNVEKTRQKGIDCDIYCIKLEGCGYLGGKKGDGHILDYVTLVTMPDTNKIITLFPSDKIELKQNKIEKKLNIKKQSEEYSR